jgi:tRNA dimethylallyltransferase
VKRKEIQDIDHNHPALLSIGIPEAFFVHQGILSYQEAEDTVVQKTKNYAKRQLTWWRKHEADMFWYK